MGETVPYDTHTAESKEGACIQLLYQIGREKMIAYTEGDIQRLQRLQEQHDAQCEERDV